MGYTHYWTPKKTTDEKFNEFVDTCKTLHKALPDEIVIKDGLGKNKPVFENDKVVFNGDADLLLDYETFCIIKNDLDWSFCKTAHKPYDLLVGACLIAAHEILGYEITSDGNFEDWKPIIEFYLKTIYAEMPDMDGLKQILPEFLYDKHNLEQINFVFI